MASNRIKGLTIEIGGDTRKLSEELKAVEKDGDRLGKELKEVNNLLKFDPGNTEALAEKQKILAEAIANSNEKLKTLKNSQEQVKAQFESGQIDRGQYLKFCQEISATEKQTADYAKQLEEVKAAQEQAANSAGKAADNINDAAKSEKKAADNADDMAAKSKKASEAVAALAKNAGKISGAAFSAAAKGLTAYATAAMGAVTAVTGLAANAALAADDLNTLSTQTGISTEELQKYQYAADLVDVSVDTLTSSMAKNIKQMTSTSKATVAAYETLGIATKNADGSLRDSQTVYWETIAALGNVADETERDSLAMSIFGKSAQELNPLIEGGAEKIQELGEQAAAAGMILSQDALNGLNAFNDSLDTLKANATGSGRIIGAAFADMAKPVTDIIGSVLPQLAADLAGVFSGETTAEELQAGISDMGGKITTYIVEIMPTVLTGFNSVLLAVLGSISDTAPAAITGLLPSLFDGFNGLVSGLIEQIPVLIPIVIDGGIMLFMGLLDSLQNVSDTLMPMLPDLITNVCDTLTENIPTLITGAVTLFTGLVLGLGDAVPALIEGVYTVVPTVAAALLENIPALIECAVQLFIALAQGIPQAIPTVIEGIPTMINAIVDALMGYDWLSLGAELITGVGKGIIDGAKSIGTAVKDGVGNMWDGIKGVFGGDTQNNTDDTTTYGGAGAGGTRGGNITYVQNNYSPKALSRDEINRDTQRQLQLAGMK